LSILKKGAGLMEIYGYAGHILYVDLTDGKIEKIPLELRDAAEFIGGWGLNAKLAYENIEPGIDAFSPENSIIIGAGLLGGTLSPSTCKTFATYKCPATGTIATAVGGGGLSASLKWAGYDHLIIRGRSEKPVYLKILDDDVEICDADKLWGKDLLLATDKLRDEYGGTCQILSIGPAGEKMVKIAIALNNKGPTLGRTLGGVMGSKNLKAVVVRGTKGIKVADRERFMKMVDELAEKALRDPLREGWTSLGLHFVFPVWAKVGHLFTYKNWKEIYADEERAIKYYGPEQYRRIKKSTIACPSCITGDKAVIELKEGAGLTTFASCPIVASVAYGVKFGLDSQNDAFRLHDLANRLGLDEASFSNLLDFAIDLYDRGILTDKFLKGIELTPDFHTIARLMEMTASRIDFGDHLAQGWLGFIEKIGKDSERHALIIKGADPDFDARISFGVETLGSVTNPRAAHDMPVGGLTIALGRKPEFFQKIGARMGIPKEVAERIFSHSGFDLGRFQAHYENWATLLNCLGICFRMQSSSLYTADICAELYSSATGIETDAQNLIKGAERAYNLYKMANVREGFDRKDDRFPEQWVDQPLKKGQEELWLMDYFKARRLTREDLEKILDNYYEERGWSKEKGIPSREKLSELGLISF